MELIGGRPFEVDRARALVEHDGTAVFFAPCGIPTRFDHDNVNTIMVYTPKPARKRSALTAPPPADSLAFNAQTNAVP